MPTSEIQRESRIGENPTYGLVCEVKPTRRRRGGFTLIELLIVIAIISILMALFLPALKTAKDQTKSTACSNLLRQYGLCSMYYAEDYNGFLPTVNNGTQWVCYLVDTPSFSELGKSPGGGIWDWKMCPARPDTKYGSNLRTNYGMALFINNAVTVIYWYPPLHRQKHPAHRAYFFDAQGANSDPANPNACNYYMSRQLSHDLWSYNNIHRKNFNLVFLDCHVESRSRFNVDVNGLFTWDAP